MREPIKNEQRISTFDQMMQDAGFQQRFDEKYETLLLSELAQAMMEDDQISVGELARQIGMSPTS